MRSNNRSVAIAGIAVEPPVATEPPYFTRADIDALGAAPHLVRAPHVVGESHVGCTTLMARAPYVVALGEYRGELRRAIHALKFRNARWIAVRFGRHLAHAVQEYSHQAEARGVPLEPIDVVTFAPTTHRRMRLRGHDQSALLATSVGRTLRARCTRTLRRVDDRVQTGSSRTDRLRGPRYVVRGHAVRGCTVLLVDDVLTTGSTLRRAREALMQAGAREVRCAVVAYVKAPPLSRVE